MVRGLSLLGILGLTLSSCRLEDRGAALFDIELEGGKALTENDFRGLLPAAMFDLRGDMSLEEVSKTHGLEGEDGGKDYRDARMWNVDLKGGSAFTGATFFFDSKGLMKIKFWGGMPLPSRGRVERCYTSLKRLLGAPDAMYHLKRNPGSQLAIRWNRPGGRLLYQVGSGSFNSMNFDLVYTPERVAEERLWNAPAWNKVATNDATFAATLDGIRNLPAGDGGFPAIEPKEDESGRLEQFGTAISKQGLPYWDAQYEALHGKLVELLAADYRDLKKTEVFERMAKICRGEIRELRGDDTQAGAAAYLASFDDLEAIEYLFGGLTVESPLSVPLNCADGISRLCTGEVMERVLKMLDGSDKELDAGYTILHGLKTKKQLQELERKFRLVKTAAGKKAAGGAIFNLRRDNLR